MSENEILEKCLRNKIIIIDELLKTADFNMVNSILSKYPIHYYEILNEWYLKKDYKSLFEFAVDYGLREMAQFLIRKAYDYLEEELMECWKQNKDLESNLERNKKYLSGTFYLYNGEQILKNIEKIKKDILSELEKKENKKKEFDHLKREYFESELEKGNFKIVAIELCVKLEFIFTNFYEYSGTLDDMLKEYSKVNRCDLLYKLKEYRNDVVHCDKNGIEMSLEEFKECIDIVCSIEKGETKNG